MIGDVDGEQVCWLGHAGVLGDDMLLPGGSKKLSPTRYTLAGPVAEFCERTAPRG